MLGPVEEGLRWLIQSPSGTGLRTGLEGVWLRTFWPVEEVRGGMAFGERRFSDTIVVVALLRKLTLEHGAGAEKSRRFKEVSLRASRPEQLKWRRLLEERYT